MDDLRPLRTFLVVSQTRSFAAAGRQLGMTPATVTRDVAKLEDTLGQQLLLRTTRQVSLTNAGAVVAARYAPLVQDFDAATEDMQHLAQPDRGRLRINAPVSMGLRLLPGVLSSFRLAYPHVDVQVTMTDRLIDVIEEDCDLAIRVSAPPTDKSTIWRKICLVPRYVVAAPAVLDRLNHPQTPRDLPEALCLSYGSGPHPEVWEFSRRQSTATHRAGTAVISNNGDLLHALACQGMGIALLPGFLVETSIAAGKLGILLPDWTATPLWLTLFYPPYEKYPPLVATFSNFFETYLRDTAPSVFDWGDCHDPVTQGH